MGPIGWTLLILFIVVWPPLLFLLIGMLTGWRWFARTYPAREPAADAAGSGVISVMLGIIGRYNNCVLWRIDDAHLHLRMLPVLAWMLHPPMSLPWGEMELVAQRGPWTVWRIDGRRLTLPRKVVERELAVREAMET